MRGHSFYSICFCFPKAEIVHAHHACLSSKIPKEVELIAKEVKLAIQAAAYVADGQKAERAIATAGSDKIM